MTMLVTGCVFWLATSRALLAWSDRASGAHTVGETRHDDAPQWPTRRGRDPVGAERCSSAAWTSSRDGRRSSLALLARVRRARGFGRVCRAASAEPGRRNMGLGRDALALGSWSSASRRSCTERAGSRSLGCGHVRGCTPADRRRRIRVSRRSQRWSRSKLVVGMDLIGRSDVQQFRLVLPECRPSRRTSRSTPRWSSRCAARSSTGSPSTSRSRNSSRRRHRRVKATGVEQCLELIPQVAEQQEERRAAARRPATDLAARPRRSGGGLSASATHFTRSRLPIGILGPALPRAAALALRRPAGLAARDDRPRRDRTEQYEAHRYRGGRGRAQSRCSRQRFGMPFWRGLKDRVSAASPACRTIVAARAAQPRARGGGAPRLPGPAVLDHAAPGGRVRPARDPAHHQQHQDADKRSSPRLDDATSRATTSPTRLVRRGTERHAHAGADRTTTSSNPIRSTAPGVLFLTLHNSASISQQASRRRGLGAALANLAADSTIIPGPHGPLEALAAFRMTLTTAERPRCSRTDVRARNIDGTRSGLAELVYDGTITSRVAGRRHACWRGRAFEHWRPA